MLKWSINELSILKKAWGNGQRALLVATFLFLASISLLMSVVINNLLKDGPYEPIHNKNPQKVESVKDGIVTVTAIKCNSSNKDIAVEGKAFYRNVETNELIFSQEGIGIRQPGCRTLYYQNKIPDSVFPGLWRIEGIEITRSGSDEQRIPWYTESFIVESW